eukprot:TRINITY_DN18343_c0_g1_i6.p1 TRINITY_DN18343_c0_g1~~TRINITY_DN18343_c0_g1_i6.p1  ORF type:complete len:384 (-),score=109.72 TRINITY_DN18343_c0_g1_i6:74-1225(-)
MALYHFRCPKVEEVNLANVFLVKQSEALENLQLATDVRNKVVMVLNEAAESDVSNPVAAIDAIEEYIPYVIAMNHQITETKNKDMRKRLFFRWSSVMDQDCTKTHDLAVFEQELCCCLVNLAFANYQAAEGALENDSVKNYLRKSGSDEKDVSPEKLAAQRVRSAAGIFEFLQKTFLDSMSPRQELRPVESYVAACQTMTELCKVHIQEILIRTAISKNLKPSLIAELCVGVDAKYQEVSLTLGGLNRHYHHVDESFKLYLKLKSMFYDGLSLAFQAKACEPDLKYGHAIALNRMSIESFKRISVPADHQHLSLLKLKFLADAQIKQVSQALETLEKDNQQIYFDLIPSTSEVTLPGRKFSNSMEEITKYELPSASELKFFDL